MNNIEKAMSSSDAKGKDNPFTEHLSEILETSGEGVLTVDKDGKVVHMNERLLKMWHIPHSLSGANNEPRLLSRAVGQLDQPKQFLKTIKRLSKSFEADFEIIKFKDSRVFERSSIPLIAGGKLSGRLWTFRDISDRVKNENKKEELISRFASRNIELNRFASTVSHDLRSPLVTISGFIGLAVISLENGDVDKVKEYLQKCRTASDKMMELIKEMLILAKTGQIVNEKLSMISIVNEAICSITQELQSNHVQVEIEGDLPEVQGDHRILIQLFQNLLTNALKYSSPDRETHISVGCKQDESRDVFYVRDNGIGIDPADKEKIFRSFTQINSKTEGIGMGLAYVKSIVETHGGHIWVESEGRGKGSTFCFTLQSNDRRDTC